MNRGNYEKKNVWDNQEIVSLRVERKNDEDKKCCSGEEKMTDRRLKKKK